MTLLMILLFYLESLETLVVDLGAKSLDLEASWTKIQDFADLPGEPVWLVHPCSEDIGHKELYILR